MNLTVVTPPTEEPVSNAEAKLQARVDLSHEEALFTSWIKTARELCEGLARRAFVTQTLSLTLDDWPDSPFKLPRPPLIAVDSIKYKDEDGDESTMSASDYVVDTASTPGRLALADGASWPSSNLYPVGAITIQFQAGYGDPEDVPEIYKLAIKLLVSHWYEHREGTVERSIWLDDVPFGVKALLNADRGSF